MVLNKQEKRRQAESKCVMSRQRKAASFIESIEQSYRSVQLVDCDTCHYGIAVETDNLEEFFEEYQIGKVLMNELDEKVSLLHIMTLFRLHNANVFVHCRYSEADIEHGR